MKPKTSLSTTFCVPVPAGLAVLVLLLLAAGCSGNGPVPGGQGPDGPALNGTRWVLTGYLSGGTVIAPLAGTAVTLEFSRENGITGSAGCNHYFASAAVQGSSITIGPAGSTLMLCSGPGVMEQESAYLGLLGRAASVTAGSGTLAFSDSAGITILKFARQVPPAPEPLAGTNWTLDSIYDGGAVSSVLAGTTVTAVFDRAGTVGGSAGCNHYTGSWTVAGSTLAIHSVISTKMHCTGPGIMLQETAFLNALRSVSSFSIEGGRLVLAGADGSPLLTFTAGT